MSIAGEKIGDIDFTFFCVYDQHVKFSNHMNNCCFYIILGLEQFFPQKYNMYFIVVWFAFNGISVLIFVYLTLENKIS